MTRCRGITGGGSTEEDLFIGVEWTSFPVTFHQNKGRFVRLTEDNRVATSISTGIVFTAEPLSFGKLFKVTRTKSMRVRHDRWVGRLDIGFTREDPTNSILTECCCLKWQMNHKDMLHTSSSVLNFNDKKLSELGFVIENFTEGHSLGLLLDGTVTDRECHWFLDDEWRGSVQMRDFPLDQPMWGVVDVHGLCGQVRADICTVSKCPPDSERRLMAMGLIAEPTHFLVQRLQETNSDLQERLTEINEELSQAQSNHRQLQQETSCERERAAAEVQQLTQSRQQLAQSIEKLTEYLPLLTQSHRQLQRTNAENQQLVATLRGQVDELQQRVSSSP